MKLRFICMGAGLLFCFMSAGAYAQLPPNYQELSAETKRDLLWSEITASYDEQPLPKLGGNSFGEILAKIQGLFNLKPTFDHSSDELPEGRIKLSHVNGSVGKIAFIPAANHPFTGIYQTGGIGIVRFALATPPANDSFTPGMAIKFLISEAPSVNIHTMNTLEGQHENWNFFAKDFSNQIPHAKDWTLKALERIFELTRDPANKMSLWHLAAWTTEGKFKDIPVFPERIYFRPSATVKNLIPENSREDFRVSLYQIPMGPLYDVYGKYKGTEYYIGTLMLESSLLATKYGDRNLFFQHQR